MREHEDIIERITTIYWRRTEGPIPGSTEDAEGD
jgi:hypothetical protein